MPMPESCNSNRSRWVSAPANRSETRINTLPRPVNLMALPPRWANTHSRRWGVSVERSR